MVGYLVVWGDLSDADLDAVGDLLRMTTSGVLVRYSTPWWEFGGIIRPGYDQSWCKGGDDDNERWHRGVGLKTIYSMVTIVKTHVLTLRFYTTTKPMEWQSTKWEILLILFRPNISPPHLWSFIQIATKIMIEEPTIINPLNVCIRLTSFIYSFSKRRQP